MPYEIRHFRPLNGGPRLDLPAGAPNVMRRGFAPATPQGRTDRRNMLIPKPRERSEFIPALPPRELSWLAGNLGPAERRALREIAETGDLVKENGHTYLVARVSSPTIDALAAFEAEGEGREIEDLDEPGTDNEASLADIGCQGSACSEDRELDTSDFEPDHDEEEVGYRECDASLAAMVEG